MIHSRLQRTIQIAIFAIFFMAVGASTALAVQTHMQNARSDLYSALHELNQASSDKGGHRNYAINNVNAAINQVNMGIEYAASH